MSRERVQTRNGSLVWVVYHSLTGELHATARLEPVRQLRKLGWQVTLIAPGRPGGERSIRGVAAYCMPAPKSYFLGQVVFHLRVLGLLLRKGRAVDVVLCHQLSAPWLLSLKVVRCLARRKRPLLVVDSRTIPMLVRTNKDRLRAWFFSLGNRLAIIRAEHDLAGAWARDNLGNWEHDVTPGGDRQREQAFRLGINIIMYALCLDYKNEEPHRRFNQRTIEE